jgi:penicillin-binding protein 2
MHDNYKYRVLYIKIFVGIIAAVLVGQLINLQLISSYRQQADDNAFFRKVIYAPRGLIYDRNGKLLVFNQPIFDIEITFKVWENLKAEHILIDTALLCKTLSISQESFDLRLKNVKNKEKNPGYSTLIPQRMLTQLLPSDAAVLQEVLWKFPGVSIVQRTMRQYTTQNAAHALGSIGEVSKEIIKKEPAIYRQGDYIGVSGVEKQYEEALRGKNGIEIFLRDVKGRIQSRYKGGKEDVSPIGGETIKLSIDIDLQAYGELLMSNKVGSIVCIEPATGEILALVSSPSFNPATLVGRQRSENYNLLLNNPYKPLFDRPLMAQYPPGSTFKTVNALVFQHEEIINTETRYPCYAGFIVGNFRVGCHIHASPLNLPNSISNSCNAYYCYGLRAMLDNKKYGSIQNAFESWKKDIVSFGFGYKLGIDFPNESRGFIPNALWYNKHFGTENWKSLNIVSIAIGQGEITATPVQIANLAAAISNRGYWVRPHILKELENTPLDTAYTQKQKTNVEPEYFEPVVLGMQWAVNGGGSGSTARIARIDDIIVCGKTGTAENPHGKDHSIFMAFAPKDNPKIAIAIVVENTGFGATWAAPIASLMIEKYLKGEIPEKRKAIETRMINANLMPTKAY